jgi:hypothetical protein
VTTPERQMLTALEIARARQQTGADQKRLRDMLHLPDGYRGCWLWLGPVRSLQPLFGGELSMSGCHLDARSSVRRYFYEMVFGPLPAGETALWPDCPEVQAARRRNPHQIKLPDHLRKRHIRCVNPLHARFALDREKPAVKRVLVRFAPQPDWCDLRDHGLDELWHWARAEWRRRERERRWQAQLRRYQTALGDEQAAD